MSLHIHRIIKRTSAEKKAATMDYFYSIFFFYTNMLLVLLWLVLLLFIVNFLISFPLAGGILKKSTNKRIKFTAAENKWKPSSPKRHMHTFTLRDRTTTKEFSYHHTQFSHDIAISEECWIRFSCYFMPYDNNSVSLASQWKCEKSTNQILDHTWNTISFCLVLSFFFRIDKNIKHGIIAIFLFVRLLIIFNFIEWQ